MDIVIDSIDKRKLELHEQLIENESSKSFINTFKNKLDHLFRKVYERFSETRCIYTQSHLLLSSIQLIKDECDMILGNAHVYTTKLGEDMYIQSVEYADQIVKTLEHELEILKYKCNDSSTFIGTFSLDTNTDVALTLSEQHEMNQPVVPVDNSTDSNHDFNKMRPTITDDVLQLFYEKKYGDSKKNKRAPSIYDTKHYKKWYDSVKTSPLPLKLWNELELYRYYNERFGDKYKRKRDPTIFRSMHFENWMSKKTKHLENVSQYVKTESTSSKKGKEE